MHADGISVQREVRAGVYRFVDGPSTCEFTYGTWDEALAAAGLEEQAMSEENVDAMRKVYEAMARGDFGVTPRRSRRDRVVVALHEVGVEPGSRPYRSLCH